MTNNHQPLVFTIITKIHEFLSSQRPRRYLMDHILAPGIHASSWTFGPWLISKEYSLITKKLACQACTVFKVRYCPCMAQKEYCILVEYLEPPICAERSRSQYIIIARSQKLSVFKRWLRYVCFFENHPVLGREYLETSQKRKRGSDTSGQPKGIGPDTSKPTAVYRPSGGRTNTLSIALPGGIIAK